MPPSSLFSPSPAARDNIWWLFCHFSAFSPEFCLPDKAMISNRGLIEPSHVLLCPTQLAHRQPHRVRASICLALTKRKDIEQRENKDEREIEAASVCAAEWSVRWVERVCQLSRLARKGRRNYFCTTHSRWDVEIVRQASKCLRWTKRLLLKIWKKLNEFCSSVRNVTQIRKSQPKLNQIQ